MDESFGEMDCKHRADSIMMSLLRSAMDNAHEKVQSRDGPIECLNERSKFYELAIIQIEGSLKLINEEPEDRIPENSRKKMLMDLTELQDLLQGRLRDMRFSIMEKDKELIERVENELKLRQALDSKEREVLSLQSRLELERTKAETIQEFLLSHHRANVDEGKEVDFNELKNSVEKQVLSIKQRLEDERMNFTNITRKTSANSADLEPEFHYLEDEKRISCEESKGKDEHSPRRVTSIDDWLRPEQNVVIEQMSSDIDILKGTLDLAFGRMQTAEVRPLEKQWKWSIEKETILILIKGFIHDLKQSSKFEVKKRIGNFPICLEIIDEMVKLQGELERALSIKNEVDEKKVRGISLVNSKLEVKERKVRGKSPVSSKLEVKDEDAISNCTSHNLRRTISEPIMERTDVLEEDMEIDHGSNYVAKMIKSHELIIRKQQEQLNWLKIKEAFRRTAGGSTEKREKEFDVIERRVRRVIARLDNIIKWNNNLDARKREKFQKKKSILPKYPPSKSQKRNIDNAMANKDGIVTTMTMERDELNLQKLAMEESYIILLKGLANDFSNEFCAYDIEVTIRNDILVHFLHQMCMDWSINIENESTETQIKEVIHRIVFIEAVRDSQSKLNSRLQKTQTRIYEGYLEDSVRDDMFVVFFREMVKESKKKLEDNCQESIEIISSKTIESLLKENIYMVFFREMVKDWNMEKHADEMENFFRNDIYQLVVIETIKDNHTFMNKSMSLDLDRQTSIEKIDFLLEFSEQIEGDLANQVSASEDQETLGLVTEKLERAMRMLSASKEQLRELERSLATEPSDAYSITTESEDMFDTILAPLVGFQKVVTEFEETVDIKIHTSLSRLDQIEKQVDPLIALVATLRTKKLIYKKAFATRCHNLLLAETEVDLLGDQVDALQNLLQKIYSILHQNKPVLSCHSEVMDILELIKRQLSCGTTQLPQQVTKLMG